MAGIARVGDRLRDGPHRLPLLAAFLRPRGGLVSLGEVGFGFGFGLGFIGSGFSYLRVLGLGLVGWPATLEYSGSGA